MKHKSKYMVLVEDASLLHESLCKWWFL